MAKCDLQGHWLCNFRSKLSNTLDAIEFAKFAISFDPNEAEDYNLDLEISDDSAETSCQDIEIYPVAHVYEIGRSALLHYADIDFSLYQIHIVITQAIKLLERCKDDQGYLELLHAVSRKFQSYVEIAKLLYPSNVSRSRAESGITLSSSHALPHNLTGNFKINIAEYSSLLAFQDEASHEAVSHSPIDDNCMISWSFFKRATCGEMVALCCFALSVGNSKLVDVIKDSRHCLHGHLQAHCVVVASHIPIACDYGQVMSTIELIFKNTDEGLIIKFIDWIVWRSFVICNYVRCSFGILYFFLSHVSRLTHEFHANNSLLKTKLALLQFLQAIVKQYIIYKSFNRCRSIDVGTFISYLELPASEKLSKFFQPTDSGTTAESPKNAKDAECDCPQEFKDLKSMYKGCIACNTRDATRRMEIFFKLIKPTHLDKEVALDNAFITQSPEFVVFLNSLVESAKATLEDYMAGINKNFVNGFSDKYHFEKLYVLVVVLCKSEYRHKVANFLIKLFYMHQGRCNVIQEVFLIKALMNFLTPDMHIDIKCSVLEHLTRIQIHERSWEYVVHDHYLQLVNSIVYKRPISLETVQMAFKCQYMFIESIQQLGVMLSKGIDDLVIYMPALTLGLGNETGTLALLKQILSHFLKQSLTVVDFKTCVRSLLSYGSWLCPITIGKYYSMCIETLVTICGDAILLNELFQMWLNTCENLQKTMAFLRSSIQVITRLTIGMACTRLYCFDPLIQLCYNTRTMKACEVDVIIQEMANYSCGDITLHVLLDMYLECIGIDVDGKPLQRGLMVIASEIYNIDVILGNEIIYTNLKWLGLLQRCNDALSRIEFNNESDLVKSALDPACALITRYLERRSISESRDVSCAIAIFTCILEKGAPSARERLEALLNYGMALLPSWLREDVGGFIELILKLEHTLEGIPQVIDSLTLEEATLALAPFSNLQSQQYDLLGVALQKLPKKPLAKVIGTLRDAMFTINYPQQERAINENGTHLLGIDFMDIKRLLMKSDGASFCERGHPPEPFDDAETRMHILHSCMNCPAANSEVPKAKVMASLDKLADKLGGHNSGGFFSAAFSKAENEICNIAKTRLGFWRNSQELELRHSLEKQMAAYEIKDIFTFNDLWRMHAGVASLAIMERCNFSWTILEQISQIAASTIQHSTLVLGYIRLHAKHVRMPCQVQEILEKVHAFLKDIKILDQIDVSLNDLINDPEYRLAKLSSMPGFVIENINLVESLYASIDHLQRTGQLVFRQAPINHKQSLNDLISSATSLELVQVTSAVYKREFTSILGTAYNYALANFKGSQLDSACTSLAIHLLQMPNEFAQVLQQAAVPKRPQGYIMWRHSIAQLLQIAPQVSKRFSHLHKPHSMAAVDMLRQIHVHTSADILLFDNYSKFQNNVIDNTTPGSACMVLDAILEVDANFSKLLAQSAINACTCTLMVQYLQRYLM
ncbi:hypothetical protein BdWA1_002746 [Babesia duncani]|uniref:Uncharacterized protein n=1 Tax=Babesia duncani TaxID=323732 RepID=A0AAD9PKC1_9APIC|nr:hypothetical protein BdWA1_002746 [Babesia duncani]